MLSRVREKVLSVSGGVSSAFGALGSAHNACHALCEGAIAFFAVFGIGFSGMPLMFLQEYNALFWGMGAFFFALSLLFYAWKRVFSKKVFLANAGFLVAGFPPIVNQPIQPVFWVVGGLAVAASVAWFAYEKIFVNKKKSGGVGGKCH